MKKKRLDIRQKFIQLFKLVELISVDVEDYMSDGATEMYLDSKACLEYNMMSSSDMDVWLQLFIKDGPAEVMRTLEKDTSPAQVYALTTQLISVLYELGYKTMKEVEERINEISPIEDNVDNGV